MNAGKCCLQSDGRLLKKPSLTKPPGASTGQLSSKCYAKDLQDCSPGISKEHFISAALLRTLEIAPGRVNVSGLRWQGKGVAQQIPITRLASKVMCGRHNSALSGLDAEMARFCKTVIRFAEEISRSSAPVSSAPALFAGEDIERWGLKAGLGAAASRNINAKSNRLAVEVLFERAGWPAGCGLFMARTPSSGVGYSKEFSVGLLTDPKSQVLVVVAFGFGFLPLFATLDRPTTSTGEALFRPGGIHFERNGMRREIVISWSDHLEHADVYLKGELILG